MPWKAFIDGGSRGNPGPAGVGVVLQDERGKVVFAGGFFLGRLTNNQAEYRGLLAALDLLGRAGAKEISVTSDSELLVRQINGQYKVKSPDLRPLFEEAQSRLARFDDWEVKHILREGNVQADALANRAMDQKRDVVAVDELGLMPKTAVRAPVTKAIGHDLTGRAIDVNVVRGAESKVCPARMKRGQTFVFTAITPVGLCVDACAVVIEAVLALQSTDPDQLNETTSITPRCQRPDCGAVFEVRPGRS